MRMPVGNDDKRNRETPSKVKVWTPSFVNLTYIFPNLIILYERRLPDRRFLRHFFPFPIKTRQDIVIDTQPLHRLGRDGTGKESVVRPPRSIELRATVSQEICCCQPRGKRAQNRSDASAAAPVPRDRNRNTDRTAMHNSQGD